MFEVLAIACLVAVSSAHLNHGPTIINPPNYGLYPGGYQVRENGLGVHDGNYLGSYNPGLLSLHGRPPIGAIQPLGHTGYAYAPAKNFALNQAQVAIVPRVNPHAYALQTGQVAHLGQYGQVGQVGHLGHIGHLGQGGHIGQGNYVVQPSVTFSQNAPQRIAPIAPVSNSVRIPYNFPVINAPHPISNGIAHQISSSAHSW